MLADKELFEHIENVLKEQGIIKQFEEENGKIIGRMMIVLGNVPDNLQSEIALDDDDTVFIGTFDFYDASVGMILNTSTMQTKGGLWITPEAPDAEAPSREWCEFFVETVAKYIEEDGSYGIPMYTFCSETADFTVVPTTPEE